MDFQTQAKSAIRDSGGRITPQRELLLALLAEVDADIDAEHLHQLAATHDPNISLPTVYRTLNTLEDAKILDAHYVSSDHERKVYRIKADEHVFHFTCRACGKVTSFTSQFTPQLTHELRTQLGADVQSMCMCASGLCADCQQKAPA